LPETLADITEELMITSIAVNFGTVWRMLQVLRGREGFTLEEVSDIRDVFAKFDSTGRGEMPMKRVGLALTWLGFPSGPGIIGKAHKSVEIPSTGMAHITEAQFMRLVRKHREAELRAIRQVYRQFADNGGAGKLTADSLTAAVTRLNRLFVTDFNEWIKFYRHGSRSAKKVSFDYEEFRIIVQHCCAKQRQRIHANSGYSDMQLNKLRIEFVKYTHDGTTSEVDAQGLMKLFKCLFPLAQTSTTVRNRLRKALESNSSAKDDGLDWHTFLKVMQGYDDLVEIDTEEAIQDGLDVLCIPVRMVDEAQELIGRLIQGSKCSCPLTAGNVIFLAGAIVSDLKEGEAKDALEQLYDAQRESIDKEFKVVDTFKAILLAGNFSNSCERKSHDCL